MRTRAVLHVGPNKTGSSSLVSYMNAIKGKLPENVLYPGEEFGFTSPFNVMRHNHDLSRVVIDEVTGKVSFVHPETYGAMDALRSHMSTLPVDEVTALFVCEGLSRACQELEMATLLCEYFDEVVIIKVARKQDDLLSSQMVQFAKNWSNYAPSLKWQQFAQLGKYPDHMNYDQTLDRANHLVQQNPKVRYEFVPYLETDPGSERLIHRFFAVSAIADMPEGILKPGLRINSSISAAATKRLVALKRRGQLSKRFPRLKSHFERQHAETRKRALKEIMEQTKKGNSDAVDIWRIEPQGRAQILDYYRESNQRFIDRVNRHELSVDWHTWAVEVGVTDEAAT